MSTSPADPADMPAQHQDRLAFFDALDTTLAAADADPALQVLAIVLGVDGYAQLEQQLGLRDVEQVMQQLQDHLRARLPDGRVFRFSTQELALLLQLPPGTAAAIWAEDLLAELARQVFSAAEHEAQLSLSAAVHPCRPGLRSEALAGAAVSALRQSASRGRQQLTMLGASTQSAADQREEARLAEMLRKALADDRLKLVFQSIASLEADPRQYFDVLVRLIDEQGRELQASEFIGVAEASGQARLLDRWVVRQALATQSNRAGDAAPASLFVKISEDTLKDNEAFASWLGELLQSRPLQRGELVFEFQERVLQNHISKAMRLTRALLALNGQVAIEHFGVGASPAQMIEHLPVQFIKFHASYAKNFGEREIQKKLAALTDLARQRQIKVIASHVEDANVMARLWQMGIHFIQGYHVQEPEVVMLAADIGR